MNLHSLYLILFLAIGSQGSLYDYEEDDFFFGTNWVVLVAGSNGWENYGHQADVAHAYQVVRRNGIPEENIIVMMANDVVNHINNPAPGTLINKPNGKDVYKGIKIDYEGYNITKDNFLSVLKGDKSSLSGIGSGRVLESGPYDNVFINFVGLGDPDILYFPEEEELYPDELINTLKEMYIRRKYGKILLYVDAYYSGSMFDGLLDDDESILAITGFGPRDNTWPEYYVSEYNTCLGDLFSISWLENWDKMIEEASTAAAIRTVFQDYQETRTAVYDSNVMFYGDFSIGFEKLSSFIGFPNGESSDNKKKNIVDPLKINSKVRQQDVAEYVLEHHLLGTEDPIKRKSLKKEVGQKKDKKQLADKIMNEIYKKVVKEMPGVAAKIGTLERPAHYPLNMDMFPCYKSIVNRITEKCFSVSKNRHVSINIFANICAVDKRTHHLVNKFIETTCSTQL
ncbi:legumain-like [Adelges cooleyi]|uniref:legumain-like n=1 Tax=Adelges cooleyi TaxID=133065 RepID=UPI00217F6B24|nr:legumain-like [Adelges cooleyi]